MWAHPVDEDLRPVLVLSCGLIACGILQPRPLYHNIVREETHLRSGMGEWGMENGIMGDVWMGSERIAACTGMHNKVNQISML